MVQPTVVQLFDSYCIIKPLILASVLWSGISSKRSFPSNLDELRMFQLHYAGHGYRSIASPSLGSDAFVLAALNNPFTPCLSLCHISLLHL